MAWLNNKKITRLFAYGPQNRNVWIHLDGNTGWKALSRDHDCQSEAMTIIASHARDHDRPVRVLEENGTVKAIFAF